MGVSEERLVKRRKKLLSLRSSGFGWPMYGDFSGIGQTAQGGGVMTTIDDHDGDDNDTPLGAQFSGGGSAPAPAGDSGGSGAGTGGGTT